MVYIIKKVKNGFKVCKKTEPSVCFSKKPLTKKRAMKQRTAINLSELGISGKGSLFSKTKPDISDPEYHKRIVKEQKLEQELEDAKSDLKILNDWKTSMKILEFKQAKEAAEKNIARIKKAIKEL